MESWNHSFKVEAVYGELFTTKVEASQHIFDSTESYHNCTKGFTPITGMSVPGSLQI